MTCLCYHWLFPGSQDMEAKFLENSMYTVLRMFAIWLFVLIFALIKRGWWWCTPKLDYWFCCKQEMPYSLVFCRQLAFMTTISFCVSEAQTWQYSITSELQLDLDCNDRIFTFSKTNPLKKRGQESCCGRQWGSRAGGGGSQRQPQCKASGINTAQCWATGVLKLLAADLLLAVSRGVKTCLTATGLTNAQRICAAWGVTRGAYIMDPGFDYEFLATFPLNKSIRSIFKK